MLNGDQIKESSLIVKFLLIPVCLFTPGNNRKERAILGSLLFNSFSPFYLLAPVSLRMPLVISHF